MKPKEKAKELMQKAYDLDQHNKTTQSRCKQIALIAIAFAKESMNNLTADNDTVLTPNTMLHFKDLEEVKQEIMKL